MEKSPLTRAHAHVSNAHKIVGLHNPPTTEDLKLAGREHLRAAEAFKEASRLVRDEEAVRTLLLLAKQHQSRSDSLYSVAERSAAPPAAPEDGKTKQAPASGTQSPPVQTAPTPSVPRSNRPLHLATTLASARGIPANPPSRTNSAQNEEHFLSNINGFMGMLRTPLAMPLGFAGLPLGGGGSSSTNNKNANLAALLPKNHSLPPAAANQVPNNRGIAESFYVVPPTGGTVPYSDMLRRGTEPQPAGGSKPPSHENSGTLRGASDDAASLEAENARLREMLMQVKREEEDWKSRATNAEKEAHKYKDRWDKLKDNARERKSKRDGGPGRGPLESVRE